MLDLALGAVGVDDDLGEDVLRLSVAEFDGDQRGDLLVALVGGSLTARGRQEMETSGALATPSAAPASKAATICCTTFVR